MDPPSPAVYSSLEELIAQSNSFAIQQGYKLVVVRSKTNAQGQKTWVHLACDRHGTKRNTHNLTDETRKKNRRSRRCECPMYVVASKTTSNMWELGVRSAEHNHGPYEPPPKKKKDHAPPPPSETVNLPLLQTPSACIADFCLVPIGTQNPSVSAEIAEVQRLLKRSGLHFTLHSAGTTLEGPWDDVMRIIGQAHSLLHGSGILRIHTSIHVGSRTDKKQTALEKISAVQALLAGDEGVEEDSTMVEDISDTPQHTPQHMNHSMTSRINPANIAPDLDRVMPPPPMHHPHMGHSLGHLGHLNPGHSMGGNQMSPGHTLSQHLSQLNQSQHMNPGMAPMS